MLLRYSVILLTLPCFCYAQRRPTRKRPTTTKPTTVKTTKRDPLYDPSMKTYFNPNYGYEPYWPGGEWLIRDENDWYFSNISTTKIPTVCGDECSYMFTRIGKVCAHLSNMRWFDWCYYYTCGEGETMQDQTRAFRTFNSYCSFLDAQCKSGVQSRWGFVHLGECYKHHYIVYPKVSRGKYPMSRAPAYLTSLQAVMKKWSTSLW